MCNEMLQGSAAQFTTFCFSILIFEIKTCCKLLLLFIVIIRMDGIKSICTLRTAYDSHRLSLKLSAKCECAEKATKQKYTYRKEQNLLW